MKERYSPLRDITNDAHSKPKLATGVIGIWKTGKSNIRFTPPFSKMDAMCLRALIIRFRTLFRCGFVPRKCKRNRLNGPSDTGRPIRTRVPQVQNPIVTAGLLTRPVHRAFPVKTSGKECG